MLLFSKLHGELKNEIKMNEKLTGAEQSQKKKKVQQNTCDIPAC